MPRPNRDRVMVSFYVSRTTKQAVADLAAARGDTLADTYRRLLDEALVAPTAPGRADPES